MKKLKLLAMLLLFGFTSIFAQEDKKSEVVLNYRLNNSYTFSANKAEATRSEFISMNKISLSYENVSLGTDVWFWQNKGGDKGLSTIFRDMYIAADFFDGQLGTSMGIGAAASSYGFYYKPTYGDSSGFMNPWLAYTGPMVTYAPNQIPVDFGVGIDITQTKPFGIADYFAFAHFASSSEKVVTFDTILEWWGYVEDAGKGNIERTSLFYAFKLIFNPINLDFFASLDIDDLLNFSERSSTALGVMWRAPMPWLKRINIEAKLPYDKDKLGVNPGIYADAWFTYKKLYGILLFQKDFDSDNAANYGLRVGVNFKK